LDNDLDDDIEDDFDTDFDEVELYDEDAKDEDVLDSVELYPDTVIKAGTPTLERTGGGVDSGAADCVVVSTAAVGTPEGHGYAGTDGTFKSLGNAGTEGTEGRATAVATDGIMAAGVVSTPGVAVTCPTTLPAESSVAITSTLTVKMLAGTCAERRWNRR
jgi:hypothetical protein